MVAPNPFATPQADLDDVGHTDHDKSGLWRDGKKLIMRRDARLPNACIKCGERPDGKPVSRSLRWHAPWVFVFLLFNIIIYAIIGAILSKKAEVSFRVCDHHRRRRRNAIIGGWVFCIATIGGCTVGINVEVIPIIAVFAFIIGFVVALIMARQVWPTKIDDGFVHLAGVGEKVLRDLPTWDPRIK